MKERQTEESGTGILLHPDLPAKPAILLEPVTDARRACTGILLRSWLGKNNNNKKTFLCSQEDPGFYPKLQRVESA